MPDRYDLCIEAAADDTAVALAHAGVVLHAIEWNGHQAQSQTLLPNIEALLDEAGADKRAVGAVLLDIGPGGYAGLRVGVSIAKALAHALAVPIADVGRLELDAWLVRETAGDRRIIAAHRAGRGELAWAAYRAAGDEMREESAPRIEKLADVEPELRAGDAITGDADAMEDLAQRAQDAGAELLAPPAHRVVALAAVGRARLDAGRADDPTALVPLYLRGPAIGPKRADAGA